MALTQVNSGGIKDDSIVNADIKSDAAIALSKLASTPAVLTGSTNNTITTVTAANTIQGEANLTFDGTTLNVNGGTGNNVLHLESTDGTCSMEFYDNATTNGNQPIVGAVGNNLFAETGGSERLRIDSSGRLLLGTTTEGSGSADDLTITSPDGTANAGITIRCGENNAGNIYFSDATSGTGEYAGSITYAHGSAGENLTFGTDSNERVRIDSSGNVQIGATAPITTYSSGGNKLSVYKADGNGGVLELAGSTNLNAYNAGQILLYNNANANNTAWQSDSKLVGIIRAETITTDSNAGDDSGADLAFYTKPEAEAGALAMMIHGEGHVTMKKMPYCKYHPGADDASYQSNGTEHVIDGGSSTVANGMACDTSNGRITVPYDGIYQINANIGLLTNDDTYRSRLNLMVNGADIQRTEHTNKAEDGTDNTDGGWKTMNIAITLALSASDYISFDCVGKHDQQTYTIITVVLLHGN